MFANTTFWIAQRVPIRTHFVSVVKNHGGNVTSLEKNADLLIADHVRHRDAPPGALSYQFLEECEKQGRLLSPDERTIHRCGPKPGSVREAADASRASKVHRTAFTPDDDDIIREWVKDAVRRGESHGGNEIWKDLERKNKRHTWQSWRDRWVKKLRDRMPPQWDTEIRGLDDDVDELVEEVLEEEARSEALQREEQESQIKEREEGEKQEKQRRLDKQKEIDSQGETSAQEEKERQGKIEEQKRGESNKDEAPQRGNESLPVPGVEEAKAQGPSARPRAGPDVLGRVDQVALRREQERMLSGGTGPSLNSAASPQHRPARVVLSRVAQAKLEGKNARPDVQSMPSSPPVLIRASNVDARPRSESEHSERVTAEFARKPSVGISSNRTKRPKHHHTVTAANEEVEKWMEPWPVETSTNEAVDPSDAIMSRDVNGLRTGLEALAPSTDFSPKQWRQYLEDDVLPIQRNFNLNNSQTSQNNEIRLITPNRKRARDDIGDSLQFKSPRVAETANISKQRVDINSQSTASSASQAESTRETFDYDDDDDNFTKALQTQAILAADTQPLDLVILDPDEALDSSIAQSIESDEHDEFDKRCRASLRDQELINQQLLNNSGESGALDLDFDLPEPEGGFEATDEPYDGIETQLLKGTQALGTGPMGELDEQEIDEAASQASLDFHALANELMEEGHSPEHILIAVQATSANMSLMRVVLEHLRAEMKVPVQTRGIWTEQDDEDILGGDARKLERVEAKHGWDGEGGCKARQYFLRDSVAAAEEVARQSSRTA